MNRNSASGGSVNCYNCNKEGHLSRDCPKKIGPNDGNGDKNRSKSASQPGHWEQRTGLGTADEKLQEFRKACQIKNTDLEGMVTKATKEYIFILAQEHYKSGYKKLYGPEPCVLKYKVDDYIKVSF